MKKINKAKKIIDKKDLNMKIRPQDDFYHFACGGWLRNNPIPKTETSWGSFYILRDKTRKQIKSIFDDLIKKKNLKNGSRRQQLRDFYLSGMNEKMIEKEGLKPLAPEMAIIESILDNNTFLRAVAHMHITDNSIFWNSSVGLDDKNSKKNAFFITQDSLGLPEKEYYLSRKKKFSDIRKKYSSHIARIFMLTGVTNKDAKSIATNILKTETILAKFSMSAEERRDVKKTYNKMRVASLKVLSPNIDWSQYFKMIGVSKIRNVIVAQPKYINALSDIIKSTSIEDLKYYMTWRLLSLSSNLLPRAFVLENFSFYGRTIFGMKKMKPRWQRVYTVVDGELTESIGQEYVSRHFSKKSKDAIKELIKNIQDAFKERIKNLDWMTARTKKLALKKLSLFTSKIGGPDKPCDYSKVLIRPDTYLRNVFNTSQFEFKRNMEKLNKPIDRSEWHMGAHVVNAYYWVNQNEIVFPAAILQPPFFDEYGDPAMNYGSIGTVIGHELTHGFDDQGRLFDGNGNMRNWWTKKDMDLFKKKAKVVEKQYNDFIAVDDIHINGKLTLGENIADFGGVALGYWAFQKYMKKYGRLLDESGFTPEQRFFLGFVLFDREHRLKETTRVLALSDPHSIGYARINGPLSNFEEFYNAFGVKKGDGMYRDPKKRAKIW